MFQPQTIAPEWATDCESCADLTDYLHEASPEDAEAGNICIGHFYHAEATSFNERHEDVTVPVAVLVGISISRCMNRFSYHDAKETRATFTADLVDALEDTQSERLLDMMDVWA